MSTLTQATARYALGRNTARPCGAGEVDAVRFASRGGLTLVGLGVGGSDGTGGTDFSIDPDAVHFRLAIGVGLVSVGIPSRVTCSPSVEPFQSSSMYLVPSFLLQYHFSLPLRACPVRWLSRSAISPQLLRQPLLWLLW